MIGMILTGHGEFAPGLGHALQMIAGQQEDFHIVAFREEEPLEALMINLKAALEDQVAKGHQVVVFTDLLGGTPCNTALMAAGQYEGVEVIAGTNLPMLIESSVLRQVYESAQDLVQAAIQAGQNNISHPVLDLGPSQEDESEDGI